MSTIAELQAKANQAFANYDRASRHMGANEEECNNLYWIAQNAQDTVTAAANAPVTGLYAKIKAEVQAAIDAEEKAEQACPTSPITNTYTIRISSKHFGTMFAPLTIEADTVFEAYAQAMSQCGKTCNVSFPEREY